jgi:3',5'-cyclic AMP phosphodiesterase CpdA
MSPNINRRKFLYRVSAWLGLLAGGGISRIAWPVRGSEKGQIRIGFYTDVHARQEWETPAALKKAAAAINSKKADLVIAGGDLITDGFQSPELASALRWDTYMKMHQAIRADLYPVLGNHDLVAVTPSDGSPAAADPRAIFLARTGLERTYYSFDTVGVHFVVLDSIKITGGRYPYEGLIVPEQIEWLKQDLARISKHTPIIIASHIPILTAFFSATRGGTYPAPGSRVIVNNLELLELFKDYNVILVLQGHLHVKEMIRWRGTTFIVGGAVCGKWWRGAWFGTGEGFNLLSIDGDRIEWEYIEYGWKARRPLNQ